MVSRIEFAIRVLSVIGLALPALMILVQIIGPHPDDPPESKQEYVVYGVYGAFFLLLLDGALISWWIVETLFVWNSIVGVIAGLLIAAFLAIAGGIVAFYILYDA